MIGDPRNGITQAMMQQRQPQGMQPVQQQRAPFAQQARTAMGPMGQPQPGAGTQDMATSFNAASGGPLAMQQGGGGLGGNLGLSGAFNPSNWNIGLPGGSLTGV